MTNLRPPLMPPPHLPNLKVYNTRQEARDNKTSNERVVDLGMTSPIVLFMMVFAWAWM